MSNLYDENVIAWAEEQSRLLRSRQWSQRVAIGRDIARYPSHAALLGDSDWLATALGCARAATFAETGQPAMADQLPWILAQLTSPDFWPDLRRIAGAPGAVAALADPDCLQDAWLDALLKSIGEVNCFDLPDVCPWSLEQALSDDFFPEEES